MTYPETLELTCVCCPMGCTLTVERTSSTEARYVSGAGCGRGKKYAPAEAIHPERVVTTTVCVPGSPEPLSVRTAAPVPRELMASVVAEAKAAAAGMHAPIAIGDVVCADACGTGVPVLATKAVV